MYLPNPKELYLLGDAEKRQKKIAEEAKFQGQKLYTDGKRPRRRTFYKALST
jgi:hypothetical protein